MNLPPVYDLFRQRGIRFVEHSAKFKTNCPKCKRENVNFAELDDDGLGVRFRCECGFVETARVRPAGAKPGGNGGAPRDDDDNFARKVAEARKLFDDIDDDPPPGATKGAAEGAPDGSYSHVWRSKDYDFPCTPTGEEQRNDVDGRIYVRVRTPDGESFVPKDELAPKGEPKPEPGPKPPKWADKEGLDFADLALELKKARERGDDDAVRALLSHIKPVPPPSLAEGDSRARKGAAPKLTWWGGLFFLPRVCPLSAV